MVCQETHRRIEKTLRAALDNEEVAGASFLVIKDGEEVAFHQAGFASLEQAIPLERGSIFRLYSMTKPITAAAVMLLVERGMIDLFDAVEQYLPGFKAQKVDVQGKLEPVPRGVSIKDLLDMTSGLLYGGDGLAGRATEALLGALDQRLFGERPMSTVEAMNELGKVPLAFRPGESWAYGLSADVLGALVEVVSGKRFGAFLDDEIFAPLGMSDTGFSVPARKQSRLVTTYASTEQHTLEAYRGNHLGVINAMDPMPAFESGGAGLASTIDDYAKFARMLLERGELGRVRLLRPATVKYLTSASLTDGPARAFKAWHTLEGHTYGNLMRRLVEPGQGGLLSSPGEYGWDGWLGCHFANFPEERITLLVMMQKKDAGTTALTRKLRNIVLAELLA